jgi:Flp pilus assembly protein TadD
LLIVGAIIYLVIEFGLRTSGSFFHSEKIFVLLVLILLPIIVCIFLNLKPNPKGYLNEPKLDYKNSYLITFSSLKNNYIFGTGPGTFIYNYSLYRDKSANQETDWQYRFYNPHSYLLNLLGSSGVAGILSYLLILTLIIDLAILYFVKHFSWQNYESIIPLLVPTILLIGAHFVIDFSLLLIFTFWLVLSLFILKLKEAELPGYASKTIAFKNKNFLIFVKFILVVIIFGLVILFYLGTRYWRADFYFYQGDEVGMQKAVELNPSRLNYKTDLAKYYLNKLKVELMKPKSLRSDDIIQASLDNSLKYANLAVLDQPRSVVAQETAAMVYRDINQLSQEKTFEAIKYFETASQLEPTNPVFYTELGKEYLSAGLTNEAEATFYKALELKNDYEEAEFGLAKVLEKQGKPNEALKIFDKLLEIYNDPQIYYEKGRLYFNQGETDKAVENFREAVSLNPSDYNYLYSLSIALDSQDEKVEAQIYLRKALEINPDLEVK